MRHLGRRLGWLGCFLAAWNSAAAIAEVRLARTETGPIVRLRAGAEVHLPLTATRDLALSHGSNGKYRIAATEEAEGRVRLRLFTGSANEATAVPVPNPSGDATLLQLSPVWLDTPTHPVLAWLEGHDIQRLSVRAATWTGTRWVHPRLIAPPGPGSQLALVGAVREGKPFLAWAAFDGKDDEILWSRWDGRRWTRAQRLAADNHAPDVTPTLTVARGRLIAAWARFDGDSYRVVASGFDGVRWTLPRAIGERSTSSPRFAESSFGTVLLARTPPSSLVAYELDLLGDWTGRLAEIADPADLRLNPSRVDLVAADGQGVSLVDERGRSHDLLWEHRPETSRR